MSKPPMPDPLHVEDFIRLQVRVQQLESVLGDIISSIEDTDRSEGDRLFSALCIAVAARPTPPSPPTEAHNMRELGITEDD